MLAVEWKEGFSADVATFWNNSLHGFKDTFHLPFGYRSNEHEQLESVLNSIISQQNTLRMHFPSMTVCLSSCRLGGREERKRVLVCMLLVAKCLLFQRLFLQSFGMNFCSDTPLLAASSILLRPLRTILSAEKCQNIMKFHEK